MSKEESLVCIYLRCSSAQQEDSVEMQRKEVEALCQRKGYKIVKEYIDEAKSASKSKANLISGSQEKRANFNRMIADAPKGLFSIVVCYDLSRFSRLDNLGAGGTVKDILRLNGIKLDTVKEGMFDWTQAGDRWKDMASVESNKAAILRLSDRSISGRELAIGKGYWPNGVIPYGYDKVCTDGVHSINVKRHEAFKKGKGWHTKLVINEAEAKIVKEIFNRYIKGESRAAIASDLTRRKVEPPKGQNNWTNGSWDSYNIKSILQEKAFIGIASIGGRGNKGKVAFNRIKDLEQPNSCPVIVDVHIWQEAQEVKETRTKERKKADKRATILSGFISCGHCGYRLSKHSKPGKPIKFGCTSASMRPHLNCRFWQIEEAVILPKVSAWLIQEIDAELLTSMQALPPEEDASIDELAIVRATVASLEAKVTAGSESALLAPALAREAAWAKVKAWSDELEAAKQKLSLVEALRSAPELEGFSRWWEEQKEKFLRLPLWANPHEDDPDWLMSECPTVSIDPADLRYFLGKLGFKVTVFWEQKEQRKGRTDHLYAIKDVQITVSVDLNDESFSGGSTDTTDLKGFTFKRSFLCCSS